MDPTLSGPKKIATKLHVNWGDASARQSKRVLADSGGDTIRLFGCVDEVLQQCPVCRTYDKAPHLPIAGTSPASSYDENLRVGPLFARWTDGRMWVWMWET